MRTARKNDVDDALDSQEVVAALASGRWMLRFDDDGIGHDGFRWSPVGEWTVCPKWTDEATCVGGGLFGQGPAENQYGYCKPGKRLVLAIYDDGAPKIVDQNKIAVRRAMIVATDEQAWSEIMRLCYGVWPGALDLEGYAHPLPGLTSIGGNAYLRGYAHPLAGLTSIGGDAHLDGYAHPLPGLTSIGGNAYLRGYAHPLPGLTSIGGNAYLVGYAHPLPGLL